MTDNFPGSTQKTADVATSWTCPTCSLLTSMPYCSTCGERKPHPQELTLAGLGKQALEAFTSYDSRLLQTFRKLLFAPGSLTVMYLEGSRKPYLGPFGLFLLVNVVFVLMEALAGSNALSAPLDVHLYKQPWDFYAQTLVAQRLEETGMTLEAYEPVFDQAEARHSKSFVFLMVLPFAFLTTLLFSSQRQPFATHLAYALHYHAFLLTIFSFVLLLVWFDLLAGGAGLSYLADKIISVALVVACGLYLYLSAAKVYNEGLYAGIAKTVVLVVAAVAILLAYRFLVFIFTLYTT